MRVCSVAAIAVICGLVISASAYDYGWDPGKAQNEQGYFELAQDPVEIATGQYEYVIDWWATGSSFAPSYEIWGFDNDQILNMERNLTWAGGSNEDLVMQCWEGWAASGDAAAQPPSVGSGSNTWDLTAESWALDNPWHAPIEYALDPASWFHTGDVLDQGELYNGTACETGMMPIYDYTWPGFGSSNQLVFTVRVVTTETFGDRPGDSPIPTWTRGDARIEAEPILGDWEMDDGWIWPPPWGPWPPEPIDQDWVDHLCENMGGDPGIYDLNGDGVVDEDDQIWLIENHIEYDLDGDGSSDGVGSFRGDFNLDGVVNGTDLSIMNGNFGANPAGYAGGNANCDWLVNGTDLSILAGNFGNMAGAAVPEPMTIGLLGISGLVLLKRKET